MIAEIEQDGIDPLLQQRPHERRLGVLELEAFGEGRQSVAALRVGCLTEECCEETQLAVARMLEGQAVEQSPEGLHAASSSTAVSSVSSSP